METFTLERTGLPLLTFSGKVVAEVDGRVAAGKNRTRWHELAIYRTEKGRYVLRVVFHTTWKGERDRSFAEIYPGSGNELIVRLSPGHYDPTQYLVGYPPRPEYAEKQRRLRVLITTDYAHLVSELLAAAGDEFTERLD